MSKSDSLIRNTAILTIGTLFTKVLSFIVIPLFSKWLSVEDYGTFDLYSTYIMLLIPVLTLSCGEAVFRFLIDTKNDDERNRIVSSGTGIIVIGILIGVIGVSIFLQESRLIKISLIIYLTMEIINNYLLSYVRGEKTLMIYAQASILTMVGYAVFVTLTVKKAILTFSGKMKPVENGVLLEIPGMGISLAEREDIIFAKNEAYTHLANDILLNYRIHPKAVTKLFIRVWTDFVKVRFAKRTKE